ncbi:kinase [Novosphingobium sp. BL-8H]|uniref:kinase n=1 Tax=Novosphingobium sp. BL-8H TaxID=3127640 RepID=UPI003758462F
MSKVDAREVEAVVRQVHGALAAARHRPVVTGICGAQGSGKSTLAQAVQERCSAEGLAGAVLSLDDLYLTHAERQDLARDVHPLLATRGVPGTHDIALGLEILDQLEAGGPVALPRFDKARDDRVAERDWPIVAPGCQVLLFEGWCMGAFPQRARDLADPINALEADEDADGRWRRWVNDMLGDSYQRLFARLDRLVMLAAPGFEVVHRWRSEQEGDLAARAGPEAHVMDEGEIARFIAHYERITRVILAEMPARADLVIHLDEARQPLEITAR